MAAVRPVSSSPRLPFTTGDPMPMAPWPSCWPWSSFQTHLATGAPFSASLPSGDISGSLWLLSCHRPGPACPQPPPGRQRQVGEGQWGHQDTMLPKARPPGSFGSPGVPSCCIWGVSVPAPATALDLTNSHCGQGPGGDWPGGTVNQGSWVLSSLSHSGGSWEKWGAAVGPPGLCRPWKEPTSRGT